jgi:hypothetical protein
MDEIDRTGGSAVPAGYEGKIETGHALDGGHVVLLSARNPGHFVTDRRDLQAQDRTIRTDFHWPFSPETMDQTVIFTQFSENFRNMEKTPLTTLAKACRAAVFFVAARA